MACLSSTPPPLMPEDDDEDEDSSFADGFADLSESDNLNYDLTGIIETLRVSYRGLPGFHLLKKLLTECCVFLTQDE